MPAHPQAIMEACIAMVESTAVVEHGKGRFNYLHSLTVSEGGDRVATILHGGSNGHPNVEASGERAPALASLLRSNGAHRVTRADVAIDLYGEDAFSASEQLAHRIASEHRLQLRKIATPLDRGAGETIYLGSRSSALFARIYEKGKAEARMYGQHDLEALQPWVRCELEVKPQKDMKALAATMSPDAFWGCSDWTAKLAEEAFAMSPEPVPFHPRRTSTDDRAFLTMCTQYRNLLRRRAQLVHGGDRQKLAQEILAHVFDLDQEAAA